MESGPPSLPEYIEENILEGELRREDLLTVGSTILYAGILDVKKREGGSKPSASLFSVLSVS